MGDITDWFLTHAERGNDATRLDDHGAWSEGNLARPLVDGVTYFRELYLRLEATRAGDLVLFTDWQGDADQLLVAGDPDSAVVEPPQQPPPPPVEGGTQVVQLLRTYPDLRRARDYLFAPGGERSVARGYAKATLRSRRLIYVEDQYFWGNEVASAFLEALVQNPGLHLVCVLPLVPDLEGASRTPQLLARQRAVRDLMEAAPGRVAAYGLENEEGTPIYVHAKVCVMDDVWATIGSDNFNRRSWTHDSELTAAIVDRVDGKRSPFAQALRLRLAAEHLGRLDPAVDVDEQDVRELVADCIEPRGMIAAYAACADALDAWHAGGRVGERPPGRLRRLEVPDLSWATRVWARLPLRVLQDPDGRPFPLRNSRRF